MERTERTRMTDVEIRILQERVGVDSVRSTDPVLRSDGRAAVVGALATDYVVSVLTSRDGQKICDEITKAIERSAQK